MLHVDGVVVGLGKTAGDRLGDAEKTIEEVRTKEWVVNEVMAHAIDVGVDHERINKSQNQHYPERRVRVQEEQAEKIGEVEKAGGNGNGIPAGVGEQTRVSRRPFNADWLGVHGRRVPFAKELPSGKLFIANFEFARLTYAPCSRFSQK